MPLTLFLFSGDSRPFFNASSIPSIVKIDTTKSSEENYVKINQTEVTLTKNSSQTTDKKVINAPLVFPYKGFTTLNKTSEQLPSNVTSETEGIITKSNGTIAAVLRNNNATQTNSSTFLRPKEETKTYSGKPTDTEVSDLQIVPTRNPNDTDLLPVSPKTSYSSNKIPDETVILIDNGENTEDAIKTHSFVYKEPQNERSEDIIKVQRSAYKEPHVALVQGQMAAILAGVFLCLSIVGYVVMLSWRRYLE